MKNGQALPNSVGETDGYLWNNQDLEVAEEMREEGGTPRVAGIVRAALAMELKLVSEPLLVYLLPFIFIVSFCFFENPK